MWLGPPHLLQANFLPSLRTFDSEGVRLAEGAANSAGPSLSVMTTLVWVNSGSVLIVSILDEAHNRCLTCCSCPETNANQHSGNGPPTNRVSRRSSAKNSSTISSGRNCRVMNWSYALNASVAYAVMRPCLFCYASAFYSALSCLLMAKTQPRNLNRRARSTFFIVQSSHTSSTFSTHSTMGISVAAPLNSRISRTLNILPSIAER